MDINYTNTYKINIITLLKKFRYREMLIRVITDYSLLSILRDTILDFLLPSKKKRVTFVTPEVYELRLNDCVSCNELIELFRREPQCKNCGCFVKLKAKYTNGSCPLSKW